MNKIGFDVGNYEGCQTDIVDRQVAFEKLLREVDDQAKHRVERERIEAITKKTGYWFEGIKYD